MQVHIVTYKLVPMVAFLSYDKALEYYEERKADFNAIFEGTASHEYGLISLQVELERRNEMSLQSEGPSRQLKHIGIHCAINNYEKKLENFGKVIKLIEGSKAIEQNPATHVDMEMQSLPSLESFLSTTESRIQELNNLFDNLLTELKEKLF